MDFSGNYNHQILGSPVNRNGPDVVVFQSFPDIVSALVVLGQLLELGRRKQPIISLIPRQRKVFHVSFLHYKSIPATSSSIVIS